MLVPITRHRAALGLLVATAAVTLAACSSGSSSSPSSSPTTASSSSGSGSAVDATVAAAMAPQTTWPGPDTPVTPPAGKKIVVIECSGQGAGCVAGAKGTEAAGKVVGWTVTTVDGKGDPTAWNAAMTQAISDKADGIVLSAVNPNLVQGALAQAKAAGIPVVLQFMPQFPGATVDAYITTDHTVGGKILADAVIKDSAGKAQILMLDEPEFPELVQRNDAIRAEFAAACPDCRIVASEKFNIGTMPQQLPGIVTTALQSNPTITYVMAPFDSAALFASQGIQQAGTTSVKLVGAEGDADGLGRVASGTQLYDLATVPAWAGWASVDALARLMTKQPVTPYTLPQRLFDKSNVPAGNTGWHGDIDYQAKFTQLWGK